MLGRTGENNGFGGFLLHIFLTTDSRDFTVGQRGLFYFDGNLSFGYYGGHKKRRALPKDCASGCSVEHYPCWFCQRDCLRLFSCYDKSQARISYNHFEKYNISLDLSSIF
jgi:hypothetical protein